MSDAAGPAPATREAYVVACLVHGAWERALAVIEEMGALPCYAPQLAVTAGRLLLEEKRDEALQVAARAVELDAECAAAQGALGRVLAARGDGAGAEAALRRAAALDARDLSARNALASLYLEQQRPHDARPYVEQALAVAPWDEEAREALKRLRKQVEASAAKSAPAVVELRKLAAQTHERCAALRPPTLSLCLIARDEARNLPRVIGSVRGLATEVIVIDTGSTDDTVAVARRLGARVGHFAWIDDFAAARNYSLSLATGEWILIMDADDEFARESIPALRTWLSHGPAASVVGLYRRYPYPGMERDSVGVVPWLFRNGIGLRFRSPIHEILCAPDGQSALPETVLTVTIFHHGIDSPEAAARRRARNLPILLRALEQDPDDVRLLFYVGINFSEEENWNEAIAYLRATIDRAAKDLDLVPKAYASLGYAQVKANRPQSAEATLREALQWFPEHPELWLCLGLVLDTLGRLEEAAEAYEAALRGRFGPSMSWNDWSAREHQPHLALCDLRLTLGDPTAAARHLEAAEAFTGPRPHYARIREAIAQTAAEHQRRAAQRAQERAQLEATFAGGDATAGVRLVAALLESGEIARARSLVSTWAERDGSAPEVEIARGKLLLAFGAAAGALECFARARAQRPDWTEALQGEAEAWRALGRPDDAEKALLRALPLDGDDGRAARSLGDLYLAQERWDDAAHCFERSLERRDDVWPTWLALGKAKLRAGCLPAAIHCYQRAASLSGGSAAVRVALGEARAFLAEASQAASGER